MKKLRAAVSVFLIVSIALSFSACSFRFSSFDSLLRPPKITGKYQNLQETFEKCVGNNYVLSIPENGEYRSAFVVHDCDSDGDEDAIAFYTLKEEPETVRFRYFAFDSGRWNSSDVCDGFGSTVDTVIFSDINNDGIYEIIIGWSYLSGKTNKTFSAYDISNGSPVLLNSYPYSYITVNDINGDGKENIFTLTVDSSNPDQLLGFARVYTFNSVSATLDILSETRTDGYVSGYSSVKTEMVNDINYIYVEALKGEHDSVTELIYWDEVNSRLVSPFFDVDTQTTNISWRNINISSMDVDGDGFLEIPLSTEMKGSSSKDSTAADSNITYTEDEKTEPLYFIKWVKYSGGKLRPVQYSVVNSKYGYMINIQSSWVGRITVSRVDGQMDFYRWLGAENKVGDLLFSICAYDSSDAESLKMYSTYKPLGSSGSSSFVYQITDAGHSFGADEKNLEKEFIILDNGGLK